MPGLNGFDAAAEINRGRRVPVILITDRHDVQPPEGLVAALLSKPVKTDRLNAAIEAAVHAQAGRVECWTPPET